MDITIVAVDDNPDNLRAVQTAIESLEPLELADDIIAPKFEALLVAESGRLDLERALDQLSRLRPGVAIVDMRLNGHEPGDFSGLDLALKLKAIHSDCCIILRSAFFHNTPESRFFRHLELIRHSVEGGTAAELQPAIRDALFSHASSVYYRRRHFQQTVNHGWPDMWGLVIGGGKPGVTLDDHVPLPRLTSESVVVEPIEIGLCGTNRASLGLLDARRFQLIDFHEAFGRVVWAGEKVRDLRVGHYVIPMVRRCVTWDEPGPGAAIDHESFAVRDCDYKNRDCYKRPDQCPMGEYKKPDSHGARVGYKSLGTGKCHGFGSQYFVDSEDWLIRVEPPKEGSFRNRMMSRYILTEPLSIVWKARREILRHYQIKEFEDEMLIIGLGPIGLLTAILMRTLHPGLRLTAVDLADPDSRRVRLAESLGNLSYCQAEFRDQPPKTVRGGRFQMIVEATDEPDKIMKYATGLLAPGGIIVLLGVSEELGTVDLKTDAVTQFVKRNNVLIGSINSSRSDFCDSVAFMEKVVGDRESILEGMISRIEIDGSISTRLADFGREDRKVREGIKLVLQAKAYSERTAAAVGQIGSAM